MQIIRQLSSENHPRQNGTVLTIGSYDGIHRGHKRILAQLKEAAAAHNLQSALITFYPRPKVVLAPNAPRSDYLTTVDEKLYLFEKLGLDIVAILPFTQEFAQTPALDFVRQMVNAFQPAELWVGPDFKLGKNRQGDVAYLTAVGREFGFKVKTINLQLADDEAISSTRIRAALSGGHIREVTRLLGDYPFIMGAVAHGAQRGRTIGFPTANIVVSKEKLLPANGVYAVWLHVAGKRYPAVANIGVRPTFGESEPMVEVHIFDFAQDIYGQTVRVELVDYLRPEQKFNNLEALAAQIKTDIHRAGAILAAESDA